MDTTSSPIGVAVHIQPQIITCFRRRRRSIIRGSSALHVVIGSCSVLGLDGDQSWFGGSLDGDALPSCVTRWAFLGQDGGALHSQFRLCACFLLGLLLSPLRMNFLHCSWCCFMVFTRGRCLFIGFCFYPVVSRPPLYNFYLKIHTHAQIVGLQSFH